jgi:galactokinase
MTVSELKQKFIEKYGEGDFHGYFAPGRVNLIGEHTDYNGGFVFPCAISFGAYCMVRKTDRKTVKFASLNLPFEAEVSVDDLNKPIGKEWVNYCIGVFAQFLKKGIKFEQGADILILVMCQTEQVYLHRQPSKWLRPWLLMRPGKLDLNVSNL